VADKHATIGEVAASDAQLFTVGDLHRLWIILDVYESDLPHIAVGAPAVISTEAYPGRRFSARVVYVGATVDTTSRTVKVRVEIPNPDEALKPGMFAEASIVLPDEEERIGVSQAALQTLEGNTVVFVPTGPRSFRAVTVRTGRRRAGGWVEITAGLALGDRVVTSGSFTLKADLEKASFAEEGD
jgi:cobalt-zinc-cadmium efflux system membrane fusion protein